MNTLRFLDLQSATEFVRQHHNGRIERGMNFDAWIVVLPDHDDLVHGHNPLLPVEDCAECAKWLDAPVRADVVEVEVAR